MALRDALQIGVVLSAKDLYSRTFQKAEADLRRLGKTSKEQAAKFERSLTVGKRMTEVGGIITAASFAAAAGLGKVADVSADLDQAGANVSTVLGDIGRKQEFVAKASEIASKSLFGAAELLNDGAYSLLSAGLSENSALALMEGVSKLAVGGFASVKDAADLITTVQNTFGQSWGGTDIEKAARATDALAAAVKAGKYVVPELGASLQYSAAAAKSAGIEFEDMLAALVTLKNSGIEASQAGTAYRAMLRELPDLQAKLGIQVADSSGKFRNLADILRDLRGRYGVSLEVKELAELQAVLGDEAAAAVKPLMEQTAKLDENARKMREVGAADEMAARRMAGASAQMRAMKNETEAAAAALGRKMLPAMRTKQRILTDLVSLLASTPLASEAAGVAMIGAEFGKMIGPLTSAVGLLTTFVTMQRISAALTLAAGGTAGAAAGASWGAAWVAAASGALAIAAPVIAAIVGGISGWKTADLARAKRAKGIARVKESLRPKMWWETMAVPTKWQGGPLSPGELAYQKANPQPAGITNITVNGGITLQGSGSTKVDAQNLLKELGRAVAKDKRRYP